MSQQLLDAAIDGDFELVKQLIESGADINFFGKCKTFQENIPLSVLHIAVLTENIEMVKYLLEKKANVNIIQNSSATPLCLMIFFRKPNREIAALLLDHGAKTNIPDTWANLLPAYWVLNFIEINHKLTDLFLFYGLIRGDIQTIQELSKQFQLTTAILIEWIKKRSISREEFKTADKTLQSLFNENKISQESFHEFRKILENGISRTLDLDSSYPQCLQAFIKKEKLSDIPLKDLIAELQYHRKKIPSPLLPVGDNANQWKSEEDHKNFQFIKDNSHLLEISAVDEFINPKDNHTSVMELHLCEGIITVLCRIALHKEISKEQKSKIINLLDLYENPSDSEKTIIGMGKSILDYSEGIGKGIEELSSLIVTVQEQVQQQISSEVNALKFEIVSLQKTNQESLKHIVILSEDNCIIKKQLADTTAILGTILAEVKSLKSEQSSLRTNTQQTTTSATNFWK